MILVLPLHINFLSHIDTRLPPPRASRLHLCYKVLNLLYSGIHHCPRPPHHQWGLLCPWAEQTVHLLLLVLLRKIIFISLSNNPFLKLLIAIRNKAISNSNTLISIWAKLLCNRKHYIHLYHHFQKLPHSTLYSLLPEARQKSPRCTLLLCSTSPALLRLTQPTLSLEMQLQHPQSSPYLRCRPASLLQPLFRHRLPPRARERVRLQ